ncbi:hypothetical protein [Streptomyces griseosporeus]|uniref:hypothetical protein n=1 Tax=Streptomyces griseosporeus TaxID=1910 RepID=UPI003701F67E
MPTRLLPRPWPGTRARRLAAACWEHLRDAAIPGEPPSLRLFTLYADALRPADDAGRTT